MREEERRIELRRKEKKIAVDGWLEPDEVYQSKLPKICPKCGNKINKINTQDLLGIIVLYCPNSKCRYWAEYEV